MKISRTAGFLIAIGVCTFAASFADAKPAKILLLRHAEKPDYGDDLSSRGWERARALPDLFKSRSEFSSLGAPAALYAMTPNQLDNTDLDPLGIMNPGALLTSR